MSLKYDELGPIAQQYVDEVVDCAVLCYNGTDPVRVLDLATGPGTYNSAIIQRLISLGIDFYVVFSDLSPFHLRSCYSSLLVDFADYNEKFVFTLADACDLQAQVEHEPSLEHLAGRPLDEVIQRGENAFLCNPSFNTELFVDSSFDLTIGFMPYGSVSQNPKDLVDEVARVTRSYHVVFEREIVGYFTGEEEVFEPVAHIVVPDVRRHLSSVMDEKKTVSIENKIPRDTPFDVIKTSTLESFSLLSYKLRN